MRYALEIDGDQSHLVDEPYFVDAIHRAFHAIEQGARRVVLIRVEEGNPLPSLRFVPLVVLSPPEVQS